MSVVSDLIKLRDEKYTKFSSSLIPNIDSKTIIGVKIPVLREYTRDMKNKDKFMRNLPHKYHEENLLHSLLINNIKDIEEFIKEINIFLPFIDNWAVCDIIRNKIIKKHPDIIYEEIKKWIKSDKVYTVRFAVVTLLGYYIKENYKEEILNLISEIKIDDYYVNMAIAWFYSYMLIFRYDEVIKLFESKKLNKWIHNKSIQKAVESYRIAKDKKDYLKTLKNSGTLNFI